MQISKKDRVRSRYYTLPCSLSPQVRTYEEADTTIDDQWHGDQTPTVRTVWLMTKEK